MEATLLEILDARDARVKKQKALLAQYDRPLLCFTMNIPGPEKFNRDVSIGFHLGCWFLDDALKGYKILHKERCIANTGCEAYYVVDTEPRQLKGIALDLEEIDPIGRLYDMDVLTADGQKISREEMGYPTRKCLICNQDAMICSSTRAHGLEALQKKAGFYLYVAAREYLTEYIATRAYFALCQEVSATPKPGLVDGNNRGAHKDMDIRHFFVSANALRPYFAKCAEIGFLTRDNDPQETFRRLRPLGKNAEEDMLRATHGVNTHKGAIFSMGILCAAAGRLSPDKWLSERLLAECAAMADGVVNSDFAGITAENAKTAGERLYATFGITGVRGQAEKGFPAVRDVGLPILKTGLAKGLPLNDAACVALLHILSATDDTNLIHRSNLETQLAVRQQVKALLEKDPFPQKEVMEALDQAFIEKNLSPGGSADLLALTLCLHFLEN